MTQGSPTVPYLAPLIGGAEEREKIPENDPKEPIADCVPKFLSFLKFQVSTGTGLV